MRTASPRSLVGAPEVTYVSATGARETVVGPAAPAVSGALDTNPTTDVTVNAATTPVSALRRKTRRDDPPTRWTPSEAGS
jgi:hypothetical protein